MAPTRRFLQATASAAALTTLIVSASPAFAESAAGRLGFGIQGGILNERGPVPARPLFGALLRFRLTSSFALEASGATSWRHTFVPLAGETTVFTTPLFASVLFYLIPGTPDRPALFSPYIAGGGGVIMTRIDPDRGGSDTRFDVGGNVGGGIEVPLGGHTAFTVDARYLFTDRDTDLNAPGGTTRIDVSRKGYTITGQLTFYF